MDNARYEYVDSRYQKLTILGSEEKKSTYLAKDAVSGRIVVKKYMQRENADIYEMLQEMGSPHLIKIYHVERSEDIALVIMEYVSGKTMQELQQEISVVSETETIYYVEQLLKALIAIHRKGIIHRDINPKNVLISTDGIVKLLDFDIGRQYKEQQGSDTTILGTVGYAAPEQFGFTQSDKRTDIYAVGVLINVMLTGCLPKDKMYTNGSLGYIIRTCTQIDPEKRYQQIEEIQQEIQLLKDGNFRNEIREAKELEETVASTEAEKSIWPGFRTGKLWKKIVAGIYYVMMGIYSVVCVREYAKTPLTFSLEIVALAMYLWLTVFLPLNFMNWMAKVPIIRKFGKSGRAIFGVILWGVLFYYGYSLEVYVREELLNIVIENGT